MRAVSDGDVSAVGIQSGAIEMVEDFTCLGSNLSVDCETTCDIKCWIAKASRAFGSLWIRIFSNCHLSISAKRAVYNAVVISYGAETRTLKAPSVHLLTAYHNRCVRTILGVSRYVQWNEHITTLQLSTQFGMLHSIAYFILEWRLWWQGYLGRMNAGCTPK